MPIPHSCFHPSVTAKETRPPLCVPTWTQTTTALSSLTALQPQQLQRTRSRDGRHSPPPPEAVRAKPSPPSLTRQLAAAAASALALAALEANTSLLEVADARSAPPAPPPSLIWQLVVAAASPHEVNVALASMRGMCRHNGHPRRETVMGHKKFGGAPSSSSSKRSRKVSSIGTSGCPCNGEPSFLFVAEGDARQPRNRDSRALVQHARTCVKDSPSLPPCRARAHTQHERQEQDAEVARPTPTTTDE